MTDRARAADVVLLHENERDIYGDTIARCVDLMGSVDDAHFQAALDPANFVVCGQVPYPDAYDALRSWVRYVHVKDVRADGALAPAGEGVARWPDLLQRLRQDGYDGVMSLEPHLAEAGQYQGVSGPDLFRRASQALQLLLRALDWEYA
jgi:sugar phosphate isomerase/epimerase